MGRNQRATPASSGSTRHGALARSSGWANVGRVLLTGVLVVALSSVAVAAYAVWGLVSNVNTIDVAKPDGVDAVGAGSQTIDGAFSILLVGSDSRVGQSIDDGEEGELNDVNLLLHVAEDHKSATVVSFPRDLMVPIPSCPGPDGEPGYYAAMSEQQLNSAMMYGGLLCVVETIEHLTGMEIPYAGVVTFDGVIGVSNAIGGVPVCLAQPIVDPNTDLDLPAGEVTLQGTEALQFLRTRYGVGDGGDTSRISNQQVFMSALMRQIRSAETLTNPLKVYSMAKAGVENITLTSNMATIEFMQGLAGTARDMDLDRINFVTYPTAVHPYEPGRLVPDLFTGQQLIDIILSGEPFEVAGTGEGVVDPNAQPGGDLDGEGGLDGGVGEGESGEEIEDPAFTESPVTGPVVLPPNITGQSAALETCSGGRTQF